MYRDSLTENLNTAGQEQMHASLDRLTSSLTQMSYVREAFIKTMSHEIKPYNEDLWAAQFSGLTMKCKTRCLSVG